MDELRYSRQMRLPEVGAEGQARLAAATVEVAASDDWVETAYLTRAGIGNVVLKPNLPLAPFAHAEAFHHESARQIGAEAWRALRHLRRVLGLGVP